MTNVLLCDKEGNVTGFCDRIEAHESGDLHLAFSVYVFRNDRKELLIQKRSDKKMLWPGVWANTCCSHEHEREGEDVVDAGERRLQEEMGFSCLLARAGEFVYKAEDPGGRGIEHEYLTVLVGDVKEVEVRPDPEEVAEWKWMEVVALREDMANRPDIYAPWFCMGIKLTSSL